MQDIENDSAAANQSRARSHREYPGDDPLLTAFAGPVRAGAVDTVVHTAVDDLAHPKPVTRKFHDYDAHIGCIEQDLDSLRCRMFKFLQVSRGQGGHAGGAADARADGGRQPCLSQAGPGGGAARGGAAEGTALQRVVC